METGGSHIIALTVLMLNIQGGCGTRIVQIVLLIRTALLDNGALILIVLRALVVLLKVFHVIVGMQTRKCAVIMQSINVYLLVTAIVGNTKVVAHLEVRFVQLIRQVDQAQGRLVVLVEQ